MKVLFPHFWYVHAEMLPTGLFAGRKKRVHIRSSSSELVIYNDLIICGWSSSSDLNIFFHRAFFCVPSLNKWNSKERKEKEKVFKTAMTLCPGDKLWALWHQPGKHIVERIDFWLSLYFTVARQSPSFRLCANLEPGPI